MSVGQIDVTGDTPVLLKMAVEMAFELAKVKHVAYWSYVTTGEDGEVKRQMADTSALAFYSPASKGMGVDPELRPFFTPVTPEQVAVELAAWLKLVEYPEDRYSGDGSMVKGWRLIAGEALYPWDWMRVFVITPAWTYYGK